MTAAPEPTPPLPAPAFAQRTARHRVRTSMTRQEWIRVGGMAAFILSLHVIGWAFSKAVRKVYCNPTITGLFVTVALLTGSADRTAR